MVKGSILQTSPARMASTFVMPNLRRKVENNVDSDAKLFPGMIMYVTSSLHDGISSG
jgi:hypothetical protein